MVTSTTVPSPAPLAGRPPALPVPLPFDDESEAPVPFVLTAAAQRGVLGRPLPPLHVVPVVADGADTRRVQARALVRSGMPVPTVAAALDVAVATVAGWTEDLEDELARRRRRALRQGATGRARIGDLPVTLDRVPVDAGEMERLLPGLAFAIAEPDEHGVTLLHDRVGPVAVLLDALRDRLPDLGERMRVALRVGPDLAADRVRAEVACRLGVDAQRIVVGRGGDGGGPMLDSRIEIRIDVRDAAAALLVRGWRRAPSDEEEASGLRGWDSNPQTFRLTADCSAS
jgi:hypothetical protein